MKQTRIIITCDAGLEPDFLRELADALIEDDELTTYETQDGIAEIEEEY